jgi:hypothetical protein
VVDKIADDLREATGGARGFSRRNLFYMRRFASLWGDVEKVQPVAAQIGWTHHQVLLDAFPDRPDVYAWYAAKTAEHSWPRRYLQGQVHLKLHERQGAALTNFTQALDPPDAKRALQATKDPYVFEFLDLAEDVRERELEQALLDDVQSTAGLTPLLDLRLAEDEHINRPAQIIVQSPAQTDHLGVAVGHLGLDDEESRSLPAHASPRACEPNKITRTGEPAVSAKVCAARLMSASMPVTLADDANPGETFRGRPTVAEFVICRGAWWANDVDLPACRVEGVASRHAHRHRGSAASRQKPRDGASLGA